MTRLERLADWLSGGALTRAREEAGLWEDAFGDEYDEHAKTWDRAVTRKTALEAIADATRNGKSGTARKVHRMATEALE